MNSWTRQKSHRILLPIVLNRVVAEQIASLHRCDKSERIRKKLNANLNRSWCSTREREKKPATSLNIQKSIGSITCKVTNNMKTQQKRRRHNQSDNCTVDRIACAVTFHVYPSLWHCNAARERALTNWHFIQFSFTSLHLMREHARKHRASANVKWKKGA